MPYAIGAYLLWGVFPAFFPLLLPATPLEILAHRIVWTAVLIITYLIFTGAWRELTQLSKRTWLWLTAASVAITINWGTYVMAVNSGHVADAALGYFINPWSLLRWAFWCSKSSCVSYRFLPWALLPSQLFG